MRTLLQDVRYATRMLAKNPGFAAVAVLTLSLGIGANTAIFSVLQGVILEPLPYRQPDRLALVWLYNRTLKSPTLLSYLDFLDWQRNARSFQEMAAFTPHDYNLTNPGAPEHLDGSEVSAGFFSTLGVNLLLGREFSPKEDLQGGVPVVIISNRLWKDRFGDAAPMGRMLTLDGVDYAVIGVLPPGFTFDVQPHSDVYRPIGQGDPIQRTKRTVHNIACIARLKSGITLAGAQAEMNTIQESIDRLHPDEERGLQTSVFALKEQLVGNVRPTIVLLFGAVGLVLLIACANVANLLLARSSARVREFAIRAALGGNRARIVRQLITESMLLSLAGGALGLAVAGWASHALLALAPGDLPRNQNIALHSPVLLFSFAVSIAVGVLFGLAPALNISRLDLQTALKKGGRGSGANPGRAHNILVTSQIALTLVLLVGAGLLFRTIRHLWHVNPGLATQNIITFRIGLSPSLTATPARTRVGYQQLLERIQQIPGVHSADLSTLLPLTGEDNEIPFWVHGQQPASIAQAPRAVTYSTGPDYLRVMGIPLLRGRFFTLEDTDKSTPVVVIDTVLARAYFRDTDPIGQILNFVNGPYRVIGVVGHVQHWDLGNASPYTQNQAYTSLYQINDEWIPVMRTSVSLVVRTPLEVAALIPAVKSAVNHVEGEQPIYGVETMEQILSRSMSSQRFPMILLTAFSALALVLASVGIYGVLSYSVSLRIHEIGLRMALGADRNNVFRMIAKHALGLTVVGLGIGAAAALMLTRLLSSLLFGVSATDPATFGVMALLLLAVALVACYVPARRATRVDPLVALRYE